MMNSIKKLIGTARSTEAKSVDLAAALEDARAEAANAEARYAVATSAYQEGLLHLDESQLMGFMEDRQKATIQRERAQVLENLLAARLVETREAETVAALTAERDAATKDAISAADLARTQYPKLAEALVAMLKRIEAADDTVSAVNKRLVEAGRQNETIQDVQSRVTPDGRFNIWGTVNLMEFDNFAPGWQSRQDEVAIHRIVNIKREASTPEQLAWVRP